MKVHAIHHPPLGNPQPVENGGTSEALISRWKGRRWHSEPDELAVEMPVALEFNGISHAVMLATPCDLEDFALGFALSEGIVRSRAEFYSAEVEESDKGLTIHCRISSRAFMALKGRRRNLAGRTGCGLCGVESLQDVLRELPAPLHGTPLAISALRVALAALGARQPLNHATGGMHAAAWSDASGRLLHVREDVGRHNALDKLIGALAARGADFRDGFLIVTSRASVEMVQKAATAGISSLIAISAPTALAVEAAESAGMLLVAFARGEEFVAYANPARITEKD
jgi:FdhD protein